MRATVAMDAYNRLIVDELQLLRRAFEVNRDVVTVQFSAARNRLQTSASIRAARLN
jgi:hypothetical protein